MGAGGRAMRRDERGVGTVLTAAMCMVLVGVAMVSAVVVGWLATEQSAQDAADLASLAGASVVVEGGNGCSAARDVAERNGARLVACEVRGEPRSFVIEVDVERVLRPHVTGVPEAVRRTATAGRA